MIHDAKIEVTCDGDNCRQSITIEPEYTYNDYSGKSGQYDTRDSALNELIEGEGWVVEDGLHICEDCQPDEDEMEDEDDE